MATGKNKFSFRISYFNPDGTLYFSCAEMWDLHTCEDGKPNMVHALMKLRGLRDSSGQMGMPGEVDQDWPGPILLEHDGSPARLLMPKSTDLVRLLSVLSTDREVEDLPGGQRVATGLGREGLAATSVTIGPGVGRCDAKTKFYFDRSGKLLSHATYTEGERCD